MSLIASSQLTIVIGLGVTGISAARYLYARNVNFIVMDSRENPPNINTFKQEFSDVRCLLGRLDEQLLAQASEIIISPGMSLKIPELQLAVKAGVSIIGDIELFARDVKKPVIAITGSNAKSTVTTLVGHIAKSCGCNVAVGGNLGTPVLSLLEDGSKDNTVDLYVLELSSFQLETTFSLKPIAATVLNISLDHMDRYESLAEYHQVKQRIYRFAENLVINRQDALTHPPLAKDAKVLSFGNDRADLNGFGLIEKSGETFLSYQFKSLMSVDDLPLKGKHNHVNVLAALALGLAAGLEMDAMLAAVKTYKGLPHRCEYVAEINNVVYINDSKATNVGATLAALEGFSTSGNKNIILIAGGEAKGADFEPLNTALSKAVRLVILMGADANQIRSALKDKIPLMDVDSLEEAVEKANIEAESGDIVLLSPACASFDMFSGFEDRGNQFISFVKGMAA